MRRTYKAMLRGDRLEWLNGAPETDGPVEVHITIPDESPHKTPDARGMTAFEALQALADIGAFDGIEDPVAWQREQRKDRPLPFRDYDVA